MTLFDERERAFENLFAHEEEMRFRALARRNQLFARWAADQLRLGPTKSHAYIRAFVNDAVQPERASTLIGRVCDDFKAEGPGDIGRAHRCRPRQGCCGSSASGTDRGHRVARVRSASH